MSRMLRCCRNRVLVVLPRLRWVLVLMPGLLVIMPRLYRLCDQLFQLSRMHGMHRVFWARRVH